MGGAFFETYVVSELLKNAYARGINPKDFVFCYRDIDQKEIGGGDAICDFHIVGRKKQRA